MYNKENDINFTILENGLDFIFSSIKYLANGESKHNIKYSILHLSSGMELIFKCKLLKENWRYVFPNIENADEDKFLNGDFISINSKKCRDRLREYCNVDFNEDEINTIINLRNKRNKLEHLALLDSKEALKSYFVKVLNLILDFINNNFDVNNFNEEEKELLENIRMSLSKLQAFVEHRLIEIQNELEGYSEYNTPIKCPSCLQQALITDDGSRCLFCGYAGNSMEIADKYINRVLGINEYEEVTQGGEYPQYHCPECGEYSFIHDKASQFWKCISCGIQYDEEDVRFCSGCGSPYIVDDDDYELCDECYDYRKNS